MSLQTINFGFLGSNRFRVHCTRIAQSDSELTKCWYCGKPYYLCTGHYYCVGY